MAQDVAPVIREFIQHNCNECHNKETSEGGLDLSMLALELRRFGCRTIRWLECLRNTKFNEDASD